MSADDSISRRQFVAGSSSLSFAGAVEAAVQAAPKPANPSPLALRGGEKAVKEPAVMPTRWGAPERERFEAMLGQQSIFWWKGRQNALLVERFRQVCPVKYAQTCSSGTAALHIAVAAAGIPGIQPHEAHPQDRCVYWHHFFRIQPEAFCCDRHGFVKSLIAEGVPASAGLMQGPLYAKAVFRNHGFFAGRWPIKELGLTTMDYTKQSCPEAEAIHETGIRLPLHEGMTEEFILQVAAAIAKVARYYAV